MNFPDLDRLLGASEEEELIFQTHKSSVGHLEPMCFLHRARSCAKFLLDGNLSEGVIHEAITILENRQHFSSSHLIEDHFFFSLALSNLKKLLKEEALLEKIKKASAYAVHRDMENVVFDTNLIYRELLEKEDVQMAFLVCLFCPLRQKVGSCFATAPAIFLQRENPLQMLNDLEEMIIKGRLSRIAKGKEHFAYAYYMLEEEAFELKFHCDEHLRGMFFSPAMQQAFIDIQGSNAQKADYFYQIVRTHWQKAEISLNELIHLIIQKMHVHERASKDVLFINQEAIEKDEVKKRARAFIAFEECALLRLWEYTLASFSDIETDLAQSNLFISLGLSPKQTDGIGAILGRYLDQELQEKRVLHSEKQEHYRREKEQYDFSVRYQSFPSQMDRLERLQSEASHHKAQIVALEQQLNSLKEEVELVSSFLSFYIEKLLFFLPEYFQELFDPSLQTDREGIYADRPVGFRLFYKNRRRFPHLWTKITDADSFISVLSDWFNRLEGDITELLPSVYGKNLLREITNQILHYIQYPSFKQECVTRCQSSGLNKDATPWAFVLGGRVDALLQLYWGKEGFLEKEQFAPDNFQSVLIHLFDFMKELPYDQSKPFLQNPYKSFIAYAPDHVFLFRPGEKVFKEQWKENFFSYTQFRDRFILPFQGFWQSLTVYPDEARYALKALHLPDLDPLPYGCSLQEFRNYILDATDQERASVVDQELYHLFPLIEKEKAVNLLEEMIPSNHEWLTHLQKTIDQFVSYTHFYGLFKQAQMITDPSYGQRSLIDLYLDFLHPVGLARPQPLIFGDSNWDKVYLGAIVNPGSLEVELWRVEKNSLRIHPLQVWSQNYGNNKFWGVYSQPFEYGGSYVSSYIDPTSEA